MVAKSPFVWTADVFPARGQNGASLFVLGQLLSRG